MTAVDIGPVRRRRSRPGDGALPGQEPRHHRRRRAGAELARGRHVRDLLAGWCSLDLHPRVFGHGAAAQTLLGSAGVLLMALDDTGTHHQIVVRSSFAGHLTSWLLDAVTEYQCADRPG